MIFARDGADALLDQHEDWARRIFAQTFVSTDEIPVSRTRDGIRFNPVSVAALGVIHLWRRRGRDADRETLLEFAGRDDSHAAQGFGAGVTILRDADWRLVPALLRCALVAQTWSRNQWDDPDDSQGRKSGATSESGFRSHQCRVTVAWLSGTGAEPDWPALPPPMVSVKRGIRIGGASHAAPSARAERQIEQLRTQSAALWIYNSRVAPPLQTSRG